MTFGPTLVSLLAACIFMSGCLEPLAPRPHSAAQPVIDPVAFFTGQTRGEGTLNRRFAAGRELTVEGIGRVLPDSALQLDQTITFRDGSVETRRWLLRRRGANGYMATLSDASGAVSTDVAGNLLHLRYKIRWPRVYMEQWLYLDTDGRTLLNYAEVSVLGIAWLHLSERITRPDPVDRRRIALPAAR